MYAQYTSCDDATLSYMEDTLHCFHTIEDTFLLGRAGKQEEPNVNALRSELMKIQKVDKETNPESSTPSKKLCEMNSWLDDITHEIDISTELDANFNFPKMHLMSHWVAQICRYGALQHYSAKSHAQARKTNLKDGWNSSCHNLNYLPEAITFQCRILCFEISELNLQALAQRREHSGATCNVLPSSGYLAAPLSSQSYAKPEFMGPQQRRDGKHPDAMFKAFRTLLHNVPDVTHRVIIYNSMREFIKLNSFNKP